VSEPKAPEPRTSDGGAVETKTDEKPSCAICGQELDARGVCMDRCQLDRVDRFDEETKP